jgi:solute carrier family 45 protein 1/2/4
MAYTREMAEGLGDYGTKDHGSRKWTATFTIIFYAWMDITVNVASTPAQLLIADFAGDRQTLGAGIGQAWSVIGSLAVSLYISLFGAASKSLKAFMAMLCVIMILTVGIACIVAKEEPLKTDDEKMSRGAQICEAFKSIGRGIKALPSTLIVYAFVFFCLCYSNSAYSGNKGQFFGLVVKGGDADGSDTCGDHCSVRQKAYNDGVQVAGGTTDLLFNLLGYAYSWMLPVLVKKFGAKWTLTASLVPQACLIIMALSKIVWLDVLFVVITNISQTAVFTMVVPVIIHVVGDKEDVGIYVGALNSANCFGQLLNFIVGSALVTTSMGYQLPILVGGIVSAVGVIVSIFFFKIEMYTL